MSNKNDKLDDEGKPRSKKREANVKNIRDRLKADDDGGPIRLGSAPFKPEEDVAKFYGDMGVPREDSFGPPGLASSTLVGGRFPGLSEQGNINLTNRPDVTNPDGSHSSVRSMSFSEGGPEILVPTVSEDGRIMKDREAMDQYARTGRHLGKFRDTASADAYADTLHRQQEGFVRPEMAQKFWGEEAVASRPSVVPNMSSRQGVPPGPSTPSIRQSEMANQPQDPGGDLLSAIMSALGFSGRK